MLNEKVADMMIKSIDEIKSDLRGFIDKQDGIDTEFSKDIGEIKTEVTEIKTKLDDYIEQSKKDHKRIDALEEPVRFRKKLGRYAMITIKAVSALSIAATAVLTAWHTFIEKIKFIGDIFKN